MASEKYLEHNPSTRAHHSGRYNSVTAHDDPKNACQCKACVSERGKGKEKAAE